MSKRNPGRFQKGYDPRAERQKGYLLATRFYPKPSRVKSWLWSKIRRYYQNRRCRRKT
jgi:hypothetical protein